MRMMPLRILVVIGVVSSFGGVSTAIADDVKHAPGTPAAAPAAKPRPAALVPWEGASIDYDRMAHSPSANSLKIRFRPKTAFTAKEGLFVKVVYAKLREGKQFYQIVPLEVDKDGYGTLDLVNMDPTTVFRAPITRSGRSRFFRTKARRKSNVS